MTSLAGVVDRALEASVLGSFGRTGYQARRALEHWPEPRGPVLAGRTVLVTGATSGIGLAVAVGCAELGASVTFLARDDAKAMAACERISSAAPGVEVRYGLADVGDLDSLRRFADSYLEQNPSLDVLVHNAGALHREHSLAPGGRELTLATHVLGPFLLTGLLLPALRAAAPARVLTMSSGGMYTQRFEMAELELHADDYDGTVAYARAKRAQVVLTHEWARRIPMSEVCFHSMHPGWVDTPGIVTGLPTFHRVMRPLLRTPEQGADTAVWLAWDGEALRTTGDFWHDRRRRSEHRLPRTRNGEPGALLWDRCVQQSGLDPLEI